MSARQSETVIRRHRSKPDESYNLHSHKGIWVNLTYPISRRGSHREWKGHEGTRHLQHLVCVLHGEHGRACQGCEGEWEGGRGDPCRKLRGPAGSQMGHRSPSVGCAVKQLGGMWLHLRVYRYCAVKARHRNVENTIRYTGI